MKKKHLNNNNNIIYYLILIYFNQNHNKKFKHRKKYEKLLLYLINYILKLYNKTICIKMSLALKSSTLLKIKILINFNSF